MRRFLSLFVLIVCTVLLMQAQGLRQSVCIVEPEFSIPEKELLGDYSLYLARAGMPSASRALGAYKNEDVFGSGVLVEKDGKQYIITNLHVVGYASTVTIRFQLHEKTICYVHCDVVAVSGACDLAVVALPEKSDMTPLPFFDGTVTEEMEVVAAGFPELANKPSWQLTRGYISNARMEAFDDAPASHIIQHTAPIDPGSSGGPLLHKEADGQYRILGINTWKAFYREGVGMAIGTEDIIAFLNELNNTMNASGDLARLQGTSGEQWLYIFRQMQDSVQKEIRRMNWRLPLDPALRTLEIRDSLQVKRKGTAKRFDASAAHVVKDMDHRRNVQLFYDNYFGTNQQAGIRFSYDWLGFIHTGIQVSALIAEAMTEEDVTGLPLGYKKRVGALFGVHLGGQVPIAVGRHILAPRVTQSAGAGPMKTGKVEGGVVIATDTRIGLDWRIPFLPCDLVIGLYYTMEWLWTKNELRISPNQAATDSDHFNRYLQHGIGMTLGVGF